MITPQRLRRADSFLGVHFDFHAGDNATEVGKNVTPRMVEEIIQKVRPDYLQCDCKGHRGFSSYPTRVGYPAPGFVRDPLRIWRDVTARHGVALFMHYSGVWDTEALAHHPEWARQDEKGKSDLNNTSVFGRYADLFLIPQLKELRDVYGVDGVWIDGECWATGQDYRRDVLTRFRNETGIKNIPRKPTDPHFFEFTEFCREGFRQYLRHYVDALHAHDPEFQIASNWAFTSFMPEPVSANVDFISGDYPLRDSLRAARLEARCMMRQGKPWDLMAWSFSARWGEAGASTKSALQIQQEAAVVLAAGGGFQVYFRQQNDGSIEPWTLNVMGEVAKFCRRRQNACHKAEAVPQIALVYASAAYYLRSPRVFSPWQGELIPLRGVLDSLLDDQQVVEVCSEHHLAGRLAEYKLIVIPEWDYLDAGFRDDLISYVRKGGSLLVIGPKSAGLFESELGVVLTGEMEEKARYVLHLEAMTGLKSLGQTVKLKAGTKPLGVYYAQNDTRGEAGVAASMRTLGRGTIAGIYLNLGERYHNARTALARDFLGSIVRQLFPQPLVEVRGSHTVDITLMRKRDKLMINLINTAGPHSNENVYTYDEIPAVGPLEISVRQQVRSCSVKSETGNRIFSTYRQGVVRIVVPKLAIHDVISIKATP